MTSCGPALRARAIPFTALAAIGLGTLCLPSAGAHAQDGGAGAPAAEQAPAAKPQRKPKPPARPAAKPPVAQGAAPAQPAAPADIAAKLKESGAGTCAPQVNAIAAETMASVEQFNTASQWVNAEGDRRIVAVSIGQRYAAGNAIPYAATSVVAAPNPQGSCDAFAFQVVPSPLSCAKLREGLATGGRQIGDLVGIPLMQDPRGQAMLVPTAANTCILIGIKTAYAK